MPEIRTHKVKILLIGDAAVGKTSLIHNFVKGVFKKDYKMTVGCDLFMKTLTLNDGKDIITLSLWDIAGQERFSYFRSVFYKGAKGALVVFDLTRYGTFNPGIINWLKELWEYTGRIPIVLIGNKVDLGNMRSVRQRLANSFAEKVPCKYIETSAKEGLGVEDAFLELAKEILQRFSKKED
ncbi:MAG: GTP-binding protein [Candidatus Helarchaeota archaeon]